MSKHYAKHSDELVENFKKMLGSSLTAQISSDHFKQFSMLIEAAIGNAVLGELERAADMATSLASDLRKHAERYD